MATKVVKKEEPKHVERRQPDWVIRCKQSEDSDYWLTVGAGWVANFKDGTTGVSLKFNNIPLGWTGDALMMKPKDAD